MMIFRSSSLVHGFTMQSRNTGSPSTVVGRARPVPSPDRIRVSPSPSTALVLGQRIVNGLDIGSVDVLIQTVLVVVNSWMASTPASLPDPLLPKPPNGAMGEMAR